VTYRTWGNVVAEEVGLVQQRLRFQGQYFDAETGLHYNRFRYYEPELGRFASADPIGLLGGVNAFAYAPNPIGWIDARGLTAECPCAPKDGATRLYRAVEDEELADVKKYGDYNIHPNSTFKRFAFDEASLDSFIKANPSRNYTKTYVDVPSEKLQQMHCHPDSGGVGKAIGIDVYESPDFYDWFGKVNII